MKYISVLFTLLMMVACTSQNRTTQWLLEAERHNRNGERDSVLQTLYKINEDNLMGEEKHTFHRLMSGCMLASVPAEMEQLYETMTYYEKMKDTANLRTMRSVLVSNHCYRNEYQKVDSLMHLLYQDFVLSGDSTGMRWCYSMKATIFRRQGVADSALHYIDKRLAMNTEEQQIRNLLCLKAEYLLDLKRYDEAEDYLDSIHSMAERANDVEYLAYLQERYRRLYHEQYRYDELMRMLHDSRRYMRRSDVAAHNMYRAQLYDLKHQKDSALQYYHLVACSENFFLATEAMYHLSQYYLSMGDAEQSYRYHQDVSGYIGQVFASYARQARDNAFKELKLTTEIDALKINRQQQVIVIVSLLFLLSLFSACFVFLFQIKKRKEMEARQIQMEQENRLLRQAEELGRLREKANRLREQLIRKMSVFKKLPSLNDELKENDKAIAISEREWMEIRMLMDTEYDQFTERLQRVVPELNVSELNFCCLLKINVSMHDLANIYCINKASVSRRKQRLKEKIGDDLLHGQTLDDFLQRF